MGGLSDTGKRENPRGYPIDRDARHETQQTIRVPRLRWWQRVPRRTERPPERGVFVDPCHLPAPRNGPHNKYESSITASFRKIDRRTCCLEAQASVRGNASCSVLKSKAARMLFISYKSTLRLWGSSSKSHACRAVKLFLDAVDSQNQV